MANLTSKPTNGHPPDVILARCSDHLKRVHVALVKLFQVTEFKDLRQRRLERLANDLRFLIESIDLERQS
jgi:hypothetical protein